VESFGGVHGKVGEKVKGLEVVFREAKKPRNPDIQKKTLILIKKNKKTEEEKKKRDVAEIS